MQVIKVKLFVFSGACKKFAEERGNNVILVLCSLRVLSEICRENREEELK